MKYNEALRQEIFQIIENKMKGNDPPETKQTYQRLLNMGFSKLDVKKYIGQCVAVELFNIMKHKQPFDQKRYLENLNNLPKEPFE